MTTIGSIGIGLFVLILAWIAALIVFVVGIKLQSNIAWIALGSATCLTIILLVIPTEKHKKPVQDLEINDKDFLIIYKNILFGCLLLTAFIGFVSFFVLHCIEPVRIKPIKSFAD